MRRCIVVIPAHNEEASIAAVIRKVPRSFEPDGRIEVLVVNDGSTDGTSEAAIAAGADFIYSFRHNHGLGAAVRFGLKQAYDLGADYAVMIDADDEYPADEIPNVLAPVVEGRAHYVIGSRFMRPVVGMTRVRRWGNRVFTALQALFLALPLQDGQSGFRAFSRAALRDFDVLHSYNYAQVLTLNLARQGYRPVEIPISYKVRTTGESFIRWNYLLKVPPAMVRELVTPPAERGRSRASIEVDVVLSDRASARQPEVSDSAHAEPAEA